MTSFLQEVLKSVYEKYASLENIIFILPSKRAGTFLKTKIAESSSETAFAPEIYSIETFVEKISELNYATNTQQLFELYAVYTKDAPKQKDNFFTFSKWAQTLLQDFNEIDRYLIDAKNLFSNLSDIQEINHWSLQKEKTEMMQDYLQFWNNLDQLYTNFNKALSLQGLGHQGLVYRTACNKLSTYLAKTKEYTHIFIGFNALNSAEEKIIQTILKKSPAEIFWDIDLNFIEDPIHDAGLFIRKHFKSWDYFEKNSLNGVSNHFVSEKNIQIVGIPKNVSQAKYTGKLLQSLKNENSNLIQKTAVVLGDENLLNPVLNAIPEQIEAVNITMGYPLDKTPLNSLFSQFIELYLYRDQRGWFHKPILSFLAHPYIKELTHNEASVEAKGLSHLIKQNNWTHISPRQISTIETSDTNLSLLFHDELPSPKQFVSNCLAIISALKERFLLRQNDLSLEYLYRFHKLFTQILELLQKHPFIHDLKSLQSLYRELLSSQTVDFQGDPLQGLQIMGMLESRNLDFETVIITSVNEGILPSGKSNNSFIPFDLKKILGLPTYKEKDAVYTYHFYRLLQRAQNIYILYNTEPDVLEGREKSRLISQLLTDDKVSKYITTKVVAPSIRPSIQDLEVIHKSDSLLTLIRAHARKGFSPTSLSNYIRNPIDFYKRNILGIDDVVEVEENVAANTFGTIIHDTLEDIYTPFIGKFLSQKELIEVRRTVKKLVKYHFAKIYRDGDISHGKNLIAFQVAVRYVENYLDLEIEETKKHQIKILGLEEKLHTELDIPELNFPIKLKGKLDRIDEKDGVLRIIDYKTGKVNSKNVEIIDWPEIITDYDYSKAFQLLCYALMYNDKRSINNIESGIISFKNLSPGLLKFATKDTPRSRKKNTSITQETLSIFQKELKNLILKICSAEIPFTEKEV